jgi:hypothetical protein
MTCSNLNLHQLIVSEELLLKTASPLPRPLPLPILSPVLSARLDTFSLKESVSSYQNNSQQQPLLPISTALLTQFPCSYLTAVNLTKFLSVTLSLVQSEEFAKSAKMDTEKTEVLLKVLVLPLLLLKTAPFGTICKVLMVVNNVLKTSLFITMVVEPLGPTFVQTTTNIRLATARSKILPRMDLNSQLLLVFRTIKGRSHAHNVLSATCHSS